MIKYVDLPQMPIRRLPFYLATEEYIARNFDESECFFMWQVNPTVIFGRNQLIENEVNLPYCQKYGIQTYRRKSGGGCVFADMSNIMFSYITKDIGVRFTFDKYLQMVVHVLRGLGIDAQASGRNDITVKGKKVSGNAFYHVPGKSIVHGTMLFNTSMEDLVLSITPSDEKLITKGIQSIRQRVTNLSEYIHMDIEQFKNYVRANLCRENFIRLTNQDVAKIEEIEKEYLTDEFIYGKNPHYSILNKARIEGSGEYEVHIDLKNGLIKSVNLLGDYFLVGDLDTGILSKLVNVKYDREHATEALAGVVMENHILNLNKQQFIDLLFKTTN